MRKIIVVREPREFHLGITGVEVVSSKDYLTDPAYATLRNVRIFNLARSYSYQSRGYYVSLLAEARGHKVIPDAKSILDLRSPRLVKVLGRDLQGLIQQQLAEKNKEQFDLSIYFGRNVNRKYDRLAHEDRMEALRAEEAFTVQKSKGSCCIYGPHSRRHPGPKRRRTILIKKSKSSLLNKKTECWA